MARQHKGDRARLTLRLPRELVERIDNAPGIASTDRNTRVEDVLRVGLAGLATLAREKRA